LPARPPRVESQHRQHVVDLALDAKHGVRVHRRRHVPSLHLLLLAEVNREMLYAVGLEQTQALALRQRPVASRSFGMSLATIPGDRTVPGTLSCTSKVARNLCCWSNQPMFLLPTSPLVT
ncbi:unnamed protein product, partial [Ectocarpus sp. 13 AM-2016]